MSAEREAASRHALDGRVRRGERSRDAIVAALFDLIGGGVLQPTAQQVADRAGVGIRSVFRHFKEMDSLYAAMDARLEGEAARLLMARGAHEGSMEARGRALVRQRVALFERVAPYKRSANLQRWRSVFIQERHERMQRLLRVDLLQRLPELEHAPADVVEGIDLVTCFEAWDRLRFDRRLPPKSATAVIEGLVVACLRNLVPADRTR